jgi:hypothetical protein
MRPPLDSKDGVSILELTDPHWGGFVAEHPGAMPFHRPTGPAFSPTATAFAPSPRQRAMRRA